MTIFCPCPEVVIISDNCCTKFSCLPSTKAGNRVETTRVNSIGLRFSTHLLPHESPTWVGCLRWLLESAAWVGYLSPKSVTLVTQIVRLTLITLTRWFSWIQLKLCYHMLILCTSSPPSNFWSLQQAPIRSHHPHSIEEEGEEEEDVLPQMEVSGKHQGLVDERLRALLMLLNQVCR